MDRKREQVRHKHRDTKRNAFHLRERESETDRPRWHHQSSSSTRRRTRAPVKTHSSQILLVWNAFSEEKKNHVKVFLAVLD